MKLVFLVISIITFLQVNPAIAGEASGEELSVFEQKLYEAKSILEQDAGKLWGHSLWSDSILVIDQSNKCVYSLLNLRGSKKVSDKLYSLEFNENELNYVNTVQKFRGGSFVTVMPWYAKNNKTIIHELFHRMHFGLVDSLNGGAVSYLDNYLARLYLRSEFVALNKVMEKMNANAPEDTILQHVNDALVFRKLRHNSYPEHVHNELDLETVEGLAVYTELKLTKIPNKYILVMKEIDQRTMASTLTRSFAYATGAAYGLIFDYLLIDWRIGLDTGKIYDFLKIYETEYLGSEINLSDTIVADAKLRNGFSEIEAEEIIKREENNKNTDFYNKLFFEKPTLTIEAQKDYGVTYDMNSIFTLSDTGVVYTNISANASKDFHFGDFKMNSSIGEDGVFIPNDFSCYVFPEPVSINESVIKGANYTIKLYNGWKVEKSNDKGDFKVVKK